MGSKLMRVGRGYKGLQGTKSSGSGCSNLVQWACLCWLTGAGRCYLQACYHSVAARSIKSVVCMNEDSWAQWARAFELA